MGEIVDRVAEAFRDGTRVYLDPEVDAPFNEGTREELDGLAADAGVWIAYVSQAVEQEDDLGGLDPSEAVIRESGVTGVVLLNYAEGGGETASTLTDPSPQESTALAQAANAGASDAEEFYRDFIARVADVQAGGDGDPTNDPTAATYAVPLGLLALAGAGGWVFWRRAKRSREERERQQLDKVKALVDEDITAFGEELDRREVDLMSPRLSDEARSDYGRALDLYERAKQQVAEAKHPGDLQPVTQQLEEGRYLLAKVAAAEDGRPLPERRPPCFFDPRHGPSVEDVEWTPAGGAPRLVPACAADALRVKEGRDPDSRLVSVGGRDRPYWEGGADYAPYAGGYFAGGLLPGLFYGTLLGSMWGGGFGGYGAGYDAGYAEGAGDGGGDWGGGDFGGGGGDWGGFGGGDFGGGDFGGGDF